MFEKKNDDDIIEMFYAIFLFQGFFALRTPAARRGFLRLVVLCIRTPNPSSPSPAAADGSIAAIDPSFFDDGIYDIIFLTAFLRLYRKVQCSKLSDPENLIRL